MNKSFLDHDFGNETFDLVITNPPFKTVGAKILHKSLLLGDNVSFIISGCFWKGRTTKISKGRSIRAKLNTYEVLREHLISLNILPYHDSKDTFGVASTIFIGLFSKAYIGKTSIDNRAEPIFKKDFKKYSITPPLFKDFDKYFDGNQEVVSSCKGNSKYLWQEEEPQQEIHELIDFIIDYDLKEKQVKRGRRYNIANLYLGIRDMPVPMPFRLIKL